MAILIQNTVAAVQPASGFVELWFESTTSPTKRLWSIDDAGTTVAYVGLTTADQGANRLKNKDLEDATTAIVDDADATKKLVFSVGGNTTGVTATIASQQATSQTFSLPVIAGAQTLVCAALAQTLTNKILNNQSFLNNFSTTSQSPSAATRTYVTGSAITVPSGKLQIGTMFRWVMNLTKTGAGSATSTFDICFGTAGTTSDTARVSFTKPAGTTAADEGRIVIEAIVRGPLSGSGVVVGEFTMTHNLSATGHMVIPCANVNTVSSAFDVTVANLIVGVCITSGTGDVVTIQQVMAECWNL